MGSAGGESVCFGALEREQEIELQGAMERADSFYAIALLVAAMCALWIIKKLYKDTFLTDFREKYVLVTGCDSGFGRETALRLDSLGFNVFATCLTSEGKENLTAVCSKRLSALHLDVTDSEEIKKTYKFVAQYLPENRGLWGLINNAGIAKVGPIEWQTIEEFKQIADVNLWGLIDVTKVFLPLVKKERGRIINLASIGGRTCLPHASAYSISKFGVEAFSDALRRELGPTGVKVSIVEPGFFQTKITNPDNLKGQWQDLWANLSHSLKEEYGENFYETSVKNMLTGMVDTCASPHLYKVVDAIVHSLTSRYPKTRYMVGWDAKLLWIWVSRLPAGVGDAILNFLGDKAEPIVCTGAVTRPCKSLGKLNGNNNSEKAFALRK